MEIPKTLEITTTFALIGEKEFDGDKQITYAAPNVADENNPLKLTVTVAKAALESEASLAPMLEKMATAELVPFAVAHLSATDGEKV